GERDPEIYGAVARRFPRQIVGILIRDVGGEAGFDARLAAAFAGVPADRWLAFRDPAEIGWLPLRR
ncbi:MAG: hypothetical protein HKM95_18290, partial [Inquilinus sp.]|nr:hypothetical protein [Inquilinus sp.]